MEIMTWWPSLQNVGSLLLRSEFEASRWQETTMYTKGIRFMQYPLFVQSPQRFDAKLYSLGDVRA